MSHYSVAVANILNRRKPQPLGHTLIVDYTADELADWLDEHAPGWCIGTEGTQEGRSIYFAFAVWDEAGEEPHWNVEIREHRGLLATLEALVLKVAEGAK